MKEAIQKQRLKGIYLGLKPPRRAKRAKARGEREREGGRGRQRERDRETEKRERAAVVVRERNVEPWRTG